MRKVGALVIGLVAALGGGCSGSSGAVTGCSVAPLTCRDVLPAAQLTALQPNATSYVETRHLPCDFKLPSSSGAAFQVFCGDATLLAEQEATAEDAYPGSTTQTDTIGMMSFETMVGPPMMTGSFAEVNAVSSNGKYVFNVSFQNAAADIASARTLAETIDTNLSAR